jgi:S-adenosylmethionine hydrolase
LNGIITLVTDLKDQDYYLGTVKGTIYSAFRGAQLVDISNSVPHFDVRQAAIMLKNSWKHFPEGTTHLALLEDRAITARRILMAEDSGHYFVAPDNGIFSLLFDDRNLKIFELDKSIVNPYNNRMPSRLLMALAAAKIASGINPSELGNIKIDMVKKTFLAVGISDTSINGAVIFIDQFNNMITNIMKDDFETIGKGRSFNISIRRGNWVNKIYNDFDEVPEGELLCHFNASGNLVVSINKMKSARLTLMQLESPLKIDFT